MFPDLERRELTAPARGSEVVVSSESHDISPSAFTYAESVHKALSTDFGQFEEYRYVAIRLDTGEAISGSNSYDELERMVREMVGAKHEEQVTFIGPRRRSR